MKEEDHGFESITHSALLKTRKRKSESMSDEVLSFARPAKRKKKTSAIRRLPKVKSEEEGVGQSALPPVTREWTAINMPKNGHASESQLLSPPNSNPGSSPREAARGTPSSAKRGGRSQLLTPRNSTSDSSGRRLSANAVAVIPGGKMRCECSACLQKTRGLGKMVTFKTCQEHERAEKIERAGQEYAGDERCIKCVKGNMEICVRMPLNTGAACSRCTRNKESCKPNTVPSAEGQNAAYEYVPSVVKNADLDMTDAAQEPDAAELMDWMDIDDAPVAANADGPTVEAAPEPDAAEDMDRMDSDEQTEDAARTLLSLGRETIREIVLVGEKEFW
jgi:hypothetical protein